MITTEITTNHRIRSAIDALPNGYSFGEFEESLFREYTECVDVNVPASLYEMMWDFLRGRIKTLDPALYMLSIEKNPISVLHTNLGAGRAIEQVPDHVYIESYNNDYYCHMVSQAVHRRRIAKGNFEAVFGDIADYFILKGVGHMRKYDIVISQPFSDTSYHSIDADERYASLDSYLYYTLRPSCYLKRGGYLCVILPKSAARQIKSKETKYASLLAESCAMGSVMHSGDYAVLIIHKY